MPKLVDLLKSLGKKGKLDLSKAEFIAVLEATKDIEIPQDFNDQIETSLMNADAAFNNKEIHSRIQAQILNGEDKYLQSVIDELDIEDDLRNDISNEKDTRSKIRKTITSLNEKQKKAKKAGDTETENALKLQVADLNKQLKSIKDQHTAEITKINSERDNDFVEYNLMGLLGVKQYSLPDKMPAQQKVKMALLNVKDALAQKQLKVIKTDQGVKLVKQDGTEPYNDKNILLELPSFIDGVLADNGLLKNSDPTQQGNNGSHSPTITDTNGRNAPVVNTRFISELDGVIDGLIK